MALTGEPRRAAEAARRSRRRGWRIGIAGALSLLIHVIIGVLVLVTIRREEGPELLPPPSPVTMVFESGRRTGPTEPDPGLQATPPAAEAPPAREESRQTVPPAVLPPVPPPPTLPAAPAEQVPPPVEPPAPPASEQAPVPPPAVEQTPAQASPPVVEQVPAPPVAEQVPPPPPPPAVEQAPPPQPPAMNQAPAPPAIVRQVPVPPLPAIPAPTLRPPPVQPPKRQAVPVRPPAFPPPMDYSFGRPQPRASAQPRTPAHIPGTIDMSLGPAARGTANATPFSNHNEEADGADWRNALSRWVSEHAYYPEQARRDAEEGDAKVHVVAEPSGRIKMVELIGRSGSMWLDLALLALFRDQQIPRLPFGVNEPIEFDFTMHYVLIRPR